MATINLTFRSRVKHGWGDFETISMTMEKAIEAYRANTKFHGNAFVKSKPGDRVIISWSGNSSDLAYFNRNVQAINNGVPFSDGLAGW